ncbi:MAG: hypothetical protein KTR27_07330 [Leptolyngbyaceae cyanobacterium MAG.088]|nr:hypothetical protein [Leptolyngbyaceae cyanobacterium MAG.088]
MRDRCDRCWNYSIHGGDSAEHDTICERCVARTWKVKYRHIEKRVAQDFPS